MATKQQRKMEKAKNKLRAETPSNTEFYKRETKRFYDNNLMMLLYEEEEYAFCNYANQCYFFFPHRFWEFALVVNKEALIYAVRNPFEFFMNEIANLSDENCNNKAYVIDDRLFDHATKTKEYTDKNGPSEFIDYDLEAIIRKYGRDIPERVYEDYILNH